jgi:prepilin-type N-terminal cleavage/methylation domain-containing protein
MIAYLKKQKNKGFTLVEFIVVITIFSIMSSVSIFNFNEYQARIEETNVTQDIALSIRQAQVYGISASTGIVGKEYLNEDGVADDVFGSNGSNNIYTSEQIADITQDRSVRGVSIDPGTNSFIIFEDVNRNRVYNDGTDVVIDRRTIQSNKVTIRGIDLCPIAPNCGSEVNSRVDIVFQRPYPDAFISRDGDPSDTYNFASIIINSGGDTSSYIEVSSIGNIAAKKNYAL